MLEFESASKLMDHYKNLQKRMRGLKPPQTSQAAVEQEPEQEAEPEPPQEPVRKAKALTAVPPSPIFALAGKGVIDLVIRAASVHFACGIEDLKCKRRLSITVYRRQVTMWVAKRLGGERATLPLLGRRFGDFDHTTVLHAVRSVDARLLENQLNVMHDARMIEILALELIEAKTGKREVPMQRYHELKTWPVNFHELLHGRPFDVRINDRNFKIGDIITFREFKPRDHKLADNQGLYTKRILRRKVTHLFCPIPPSDPDCGLVAGYVVLGLEEMQ